MVSGIRFEFRDHREDPSDNEYDSDDYGYDQYEAEEPWLWPITGNAINEVTGKSIGYIDAELINRFRVKYGFFIDLDEYSHELSVLASTLFDENGLLQSKHIGAGSGVFGKEIGSGFFIHLNSITVDKDHRRQKIGTALVNGLLDFVRGRCDFAITWATAINHIVDDLVKEEFRNPSDIWNEQNTASINFWRNLGFRRIGRTVFFGLSLDPKHPSRRLSIADDAEIEERVTYPRDQQAEHPFHAIVADEKEGVAVSKLRVVAADQSINLMGTDGEGNTLLHLAAKNFKVEIVRFLLANGFGDIDLDALKNNDGKTPLELMDKAERPVIKSVNVSLGRAPIVTMKEGKVDIHRDAYLVIKALFLGKRDVEEIAAYKESAKFGCTCGGCVGGILSERVALEIEMQGLKAIKSLKSNLNPAEWEQLENSLTTDKELIKSIPELGHVEAHVRMETLKDKGFKDGFLVVIEYILKMMKELPRVLPTVNSVATFIQSFGDSECQWPKDCQEFFAKGGKIDYALSLLINEISSRKNHWDKDIKISRAPYLDQYDKLPICYNDSNYDWVERCILNAKEGRTVKYKGPYASER